MKKLVVLFFAMIILCAAASADFLVDSFTIGYSNTTLNVKSLYTKAPAPVEKVNLPITMHQVAVMPIFAGFGYMPKDKGFYFMWEHILGVGNMRFSRKSEIVRSIGGKTSSKSLSWVNSFIFGFVFQPIKTIYVSFGSGFSLGFFGCVASLGNSATGTLEVNDGAIILGVPLDITTRVFFMEHLSLTFGVQNIFGLAKSFKNHVKLFSDAVFMNKFTLKFGFTTR